MSTPTETRLVRKAYTEMVIGALHEKIDGGPLRCAVCGRSNWEVQNLHGAIPALDAGEKLSLATLSATFPIAFLVCATCGHTLIFNLYQLGIAEELGMNLDSG